MTDIHTPLLLRNRAPVLKGSTSLVSPLGVSVVRKGYLFKPLRSRQTSSKEREAVELKKEV